MIKILINLVNHTLSVIVLKIEKGDPMNKKLVVVTFFTVLSVRAAIEIDVPKINPKEDYNFELINTSGAPISVIIRSVPADLNFNFPVPADVQRMPDTSEIDITEELQKKMEGADEKAIQKLLEEEAKALRLRRINAYLDKKKLEEVKRKVRFYVNSVPVNSVLRLSGKSRINTKEDLAVIIYPGPLDMYKNPTLMPFIFTDMKPQTTIFVEWNGKELIPQEPTFFSSIFSKDKKTTSGLSLANNVVQKQNIIKAFFSTSAYRPRGNSGFRLIFADYKLIPDYRDLGPIELIQKFENR